MARKKDTGAGVVKFSAVFALDTLHRDAKLGVDIGEKSDRVVWRKGKVQI